MKFAIVKCSADRSQYTLGKMALAKPRPFLIQTLQGRHLRIVVSIRPRQLAIEKVNHRLIFTNKRTGENK